MFIKAMNYSVSKGCAPRPLLLEIPYCCEIPFKKILYNPLSKNPVYVPDTGHYTP